MKTSSRDPTMIKLTTAPCMLLVLVVLQACAPTDVRDGAPGRLVIVGGALQADNADVYETVLEAREGEGALCVIPTASANPGRSMDGAVERFIAYGGADAAKGILISTEDPSQARAPSVVAVLSTCSGFYFTGGAQSRIADVFLPAGDTTEAYRALWQRWREGAVVAGSSAGAAMMSRIMISGGSSGEAVAHGVAPEPDADGVFVRGGMGFFEPFLDQHFLARGRIGRLLVAVSRADLPQIGFGIDENTALVVDRDSAVVVGASGVVVVDARAAQSQASNRATNLRVSLAGAGDMIDLRSYEVRRGVGKSPVPSPATTLELPADPFARWALLHLIADLSRTSTREAVFTLPEAVLRITKADDFSAFMAAPDGGVEGTPLGLSAGPFRVDLVEPGS